MSTCPRDHRLALSYCASARATYHCSACDFHTDEPAEMTLDANTPCWTPPCPEPRCELSAGHAGPHHRWERTESGLVYSNAWGPQR